DMAEAVNRANDEPEVLERLRTQLRAWHRSLPPPLDRPVWPEGFQPPRQKKPSWTAVIPAFSPQKNSLMSKTPPEKPHYVLVIGCGSIGERHLRSFLHTSRATVLACDARAEMAERMSTRYGVESLTDWRSALARPGLTGVVVATLAPSHVEIGLGAL